jgi:hypothetical protein
MHRYENNKDEEAKQKLKNYGELKERCSDFGLCHQCQQPNTSEN